MWSSEKDRQIYSFVQHNPDKDPRYRNLGLFHYDQSATLSELRERVEETVEIDDSKPEWYPWKFKYKFAPTKYEDYYYTREWEEQREKFYKAKHSKTRTCACCERDFADDEKLLLNLHHKIPIKNGGSNDPLNLISICVACHSLVHRSAWLLIEPLFVYYAETGQVGNSKIRLSLLANDDMATTYSPKSFLSYYDSFTRRLNYAQAKLFFFHEIETAIRYNYMAHLHRSIDLYLGCDRHRNDELDFNWADGKGILTSGESLYDLYVQLIRIYVVVDSIVYFSQRPNQIRIKRKGQLGKRLDFLLDGFIMFLRADSVSERTLSELLFYAYHDDVFFKNQIFFKTQAYTPPDPPTKLTELAEQRYEKRVDYHTKALSRRRGMIESAIKAMSDDFVIHGGPPDRSESQQQSKTCFELSKCIGDHLAKEELKFDGKEISVLYHQIWKDYQEA